MLIIRAEDPGLADAVALLDELSAALVEITGDSGSASSDANDVRAARLRFAVARDAGGQAELSPWVTAGVVSFWPTEKSSA